jgi:hypothetical protein
MVMSPAGFGREKNNRYIHSLERILCKNYDRTFSAEKKLLLVSLKELGAKTK